MDGGDVYGVQAIQEATNGGTDGATDGPTAAGKPPEGMDEESGYSTSDSSGVVVGGVWHLKDGGMPARPEDEAICHPRQYNPQELEEWKERMAASSAHRRDREKIKDARGATTALASASSPDSSLSLSVSTDATSSTSSKARERNKRNRNAVQETAEHMLRTIQGQEEEAAADGNLGRVLFMKKRREGPDGRSKPRGKRRQFNHHRAHAAIMEDHLGEFSLYTKDFKRFFRLSRSRVQCIIMALANSDLAFYKSFRKDKFGNEGASMEAKVLLPIRTLAYGVGDHCFMDVYQMSPAMAQTCCTTFCRVIPQLFGEDYMSLPTAADLGAITALHKRVHGVNGMLGSLDCMHTYWKSCPVAWQQSFKGKQCGPTIVLEAMSDHCLWFWHTSYGYAGAMNDLNIFNQSPLPTRLTDGTFTSLEKEAGVVPYPIGDKTHDKLFILVDGIYPKYSRFVRGITEPIGETESRFTAWQEGARKDIERAFGVLQGMWKAVANPIHKEKSEVAYRKSCCNVHSPP
jgi:Plant transposon protein